MHALAVRRPGPEGGLSFGHSAAEIGAHSGLATGTVSAQMDVLGNLGLIQKSAAEGRTRYRIAEQLFRLWLRMRGSRRIRQQVVGLAEFLEALFGREELLAGAWEDEGSGALSSARLSFAVADTLEIGAQRHGLEARGACQALCWARARGVQLDECLPAEDLPANLRAFALLRERLEGAGPAG